MDSLTHILTGVATGQIFSAEKDDYKPLMWGAIAGNIPDLDAVFQIFLSPENSMLFHRGFSHSLLLWALCSPLLALMINKIYKGDKQSYFKWLKISATAWLSHLFLDLFNTYGTGIFEPFSNVRVAYDAVNVVDLLFLIPVLTASLVFIFIVKQRRIKTVMASLILLYSLSYILFAVSNKLRIEITAKIQLIEQDVNHKRLLSTPLPLSSLAWKIVAEDENGFYTGIYYGFWKKKTSFDYIPKDKHLEEHFEKYGNFQILKRFTKGWYILDRRADGEIVMNDLRFSSLDRNKNVISFPLRINGNSLETGRAQPKRHLTFKNAKEYCKQLFSE